jgi:hypothetical protein
MVTPDDYEAEIYLDEPANYWNFNETSGRVVANTAGGLPLGLTSGVDLSVEGVSDTAGAFDGSEDSYATSRNRPAIQITEAMSISLWLKVPELDSETGYRTILGKGQDTYSLQFNQNTRTLRFSLRGGTGGDVDLDSDFAIAPNQWTHVAAVYDPIGEEMRFYFNGEEDPNTASRSGTIGSNSSGLILAADYIDGSYANFFTCQLDELSIFDYALVSGQIQAHHAVGQQLLSTIIAGDWCGYPVTDGWVSTEDWLGWLEISQSPWVWSSSLGGWLAIPGCDAQSASHHWVYFLRNE